MKFFIIIILITMSCSKQTPVEKMKVQINSTERSVQKTLNRAQEAACGSLSGESKIECLSKMTKNRLQESKDSVIDKSEEIIDKIDE